MSASGAIFPSLSVVKIANLRTGLAVAFLGVTMLLVPWSSSLWLLIVDLGFAGVMYGYLDAGGYSAQTASQTK